MATPPTSVPPPGFGWTVLFVDDVTTSAESFTELFGLRSRFVHESGQYAELDTGATALALCARTLGAESTGLTLDPLNPDSPPTFSVTFVYDDVLAAFSHAVANGATPVHEPVVKPWGQTSSYVRTPDGFLVELATAVP